MVTAIFGISNDGLNLVVNLLIFMLVVVWLSLVVFTFLDARRRVRDPFLVACATLASLIPYVGTAVYAIVRPPEFLEDAHERELEIRAAELRVRQLTELSCPNCEHPVERDYLRCPQCQKRLKEPCSSCGKPVDPLWALCPYCEEPQDAGEGERPRRRRPEARPRDERPREARPREERPREERPREERLRESRQAEERTRETGQAEERPREQRRKRPKEARQPEQGEQRPAIDRVKPTIESPAGAEKAKPKAQPKRTKRSKPREPDPDPRQA